MSVPQDADSAVISLLIPCTAHMALTADYDPAAQVMARRSGTATWFDIAALPIDLSPWAGTTQSFDFKFHALPFDGLIERVALPVRVKYL